MASNNSGTISPGSSYTLGSYVFTLQNVVSEDERIIQAHISGPEGSAAKGITVPTSTQIESWSVEANETEASVYAVVKVPKHGEEGEYTSNLDTSPITQPIPAGTVTCVYEDETMAWGGHSTTDTYSGAVGCANYGRTSYVLLFAAKDVEEVRYHSIAKYKDLPNPSINDGVWCQTVNKWTYQGKTVYYYANRVNRGSEHFVSGTCAVNADPRGKAKEIAWTIIYGTPDDDELEVKEVLVARFAIDISDADGGDWDVPSDTGEPYTTLHLDITGALSGRHNDPLFDTSYSYLPKANTNVKYYGCGGDGGHGGGGGAGASTVIVNEFGTSEASSKQINANAKRHGYGSGGGKGGKGGNGCIVIFY